MDESPLISVLMNCHNGERYLHEALESLIGQQYENWELIFFDNVSTDSSPEVLRGYSDVRIKYFRSSGLLGLGEARSEALQLARGEFICFLDVDDIWMPEKLTQQVKVMADGRVGLSFSNAVYFNDIKSRILHQGEKFATIDTARIIEEYPICLVTVMLRRAALDGLDQTFDKEFTHISDFDLICRLSCNWKVKYINEVLAGWRTHIESETWKRSHVFNTEIDIWCQKVSNKEIFSTNKASIRRLHKKNNFRGLIFSLRSFNVKKIIFWLRNQVTIFTFFLSMLVIMIFPIILIVLYIRSAKIRHRYGL